jgi:hypothetical protein
MPLYKVTFYLGPDEIDEVGDFIIEANCVTQAELKIRENIARNVHVPGIWDSYSKPMLID